MADKKVPIITGTPLSVGDLLRWDGSDWVNYPDSNYAGDVYDLARSLVPIWGKLLFLDLVAYEQINTNTEGTGSIHQALAIAFVRTGTTNNSSARQNLSAQEVYDNGSISITKCSTEFINGDCFVFIGIMRTTLLTTQNAKEITNKHAAFIYEDGTWYCSCADGSSQTIESITSLTGRQLLEIDGTEDGHIKFKVGGAIVKDFTTNLCSSYGYFQWYVNNKTTAANKTLYFYNYAYAGA